MIIKKWIPVLCLLATAFAVHAEDRNIKGQADIAKFLHTIPTPDGDMASSLARNGLTASVIRLHTMTKKDAAEDAAHLQPGDLEIKLWTNTPDVPACPIAGSPAIIKRGARYIPQDRTGMWLLKGQCALPPR